MSGELVDQIPVPHEQTELGAVLVDEPISDSVRPGYWRRYRVTWKWSFLASVTVLAVGGAFAAQGLDTVYSIATGALDGLFSCLFWASLANLVVAALWKGAASPATRRRARLFFGILVFVIVASLVAVGARISTINSVQPVTGAQTEAAQAYLTSHYTCQTEPKSDVVGRVACGTGVNTAVVAVVTPPVSLDPTGYKAMQQTIQTEAAAKKITATSHEVVGWDPRYALTIVEMSR